MAKETGGKNPEKNVVIGRDSSKSINIPGDDNTVFQFNINNSSLSAADIEKLTASVKKVVASKDSSPYGIEGTTLHNLPYPQNPFFTGREGILANLHASLSDTGSSTALSQPQAISGLGGIGKTQIACEYAHRHLVDYQGVFWITSESESTITAGYGELARLLKLKERDQQDLEVVVGAVRSWLQTHEGWLLIFDNADEPGIVSKYLPTSHPGKVLLTSRAAKFGKLAIAVEVNEMAEDEAVDFLLARSGIEDSNEVDRTGAGNICGELGYLPLAIDHAGAFIEQTGCNLVDYLESFKAKGVEILGDADYAAEDYKLKGGALRTVATTWLLSIEKVRDKNPAAEDILKMSAFLAPDGILLELLKSGADSIEGPLKEVVADSHELDKSLGALQSYSLIRRRQGADKFSMHRLVQAVIRDGLGDKERRRWVERGIVCAASALPDVKDYRNWPVYESIVPHVLSLVEHADRLSLVAQKYGFLLNQAGYYLDDRADYERAEQLFSQAIRAYEKVLGPEHPNTASSLVNLAALYRTQGKYDKAEPLYLRALEIDEAIYGSDHPEVATDLNNLALLYKTQRKYDEAEPLYLRAMKIREEAFDPKHPYVATSLNNLAALYGALGKHDKAEPLLRRALEIFEEACGPKHPDTATGLSNLASFYRSQGILEKAEPLYRRGLEIAQAVYGPDHPDVAIYLHNLGSMLYEMGRETEGTAMVKRAYSILSTALGPDHPNSKTVRSFLDDWGVEPE